MVDDILELVLDLLFDGTTALADAQKVPLAVRALLYILLTAALMGIAAYLAWQGVQENSILLLLLASGMLIGSLVLLAVNAHWEPHRQELPEAPNGCGWRLKLHTFCEDSFQPDTPFDGKSMMIGPRSAAVFVAE